MTAAQRATLERFARSVRRQREAHGWDVLTLDWRADVGRSHVYRIESGQAVPSVLVALRLAAALGCSVDELAGREG